MPAKKTIELIGVPIDLGAGRRGVDMGPSAIRIADLEVRLPETQPVGHGSLRYKEAILKTCEELCREVSRSLGQGRLPLVLGGDHSLGIGSVAGSSTFYAGRGESLGLLWFDAHGDFNTP